MENWIVHRTLRKQNKKIYIGGKNAADYKYFITFCILGGIVTTFKKKIMKNYYKFFNKNDINIFIKGYEKMIDIQHNAIEDTKKYYKKAKTGKDVKNIKKLINMNEKNIRSYLCDIENIKKEKISKLILFNFLCFTSNNNFFQYNLEEDILNLGNKCNSILKMENS